ncbi:MAG: LysE family translocator [Shewanella sp.]|nr:LysE family translocator [Shewanella sp.]MCF1430411.1 LysE family translocator [Shewanella sp.]MCF1439123.1 LysE family translocator [Shewanella sp.]MCF1457952.1 LysE family translocator [Shewanella sp.]
MSFDTWLIYLAAVTALALTPGPNSLLALCHGATLGCRRTLPTIAGGVLGFILMISLAMMGIGSLMTASASLLSLLKYLGGAYLVYLGIQLWRSPGLQLNIQDAVQPNWRAQCQQGFLAAIANPKVLLFFGAFLPQFMSPDAPFWQQFILLVGTFAAVECLAELVVAMLASRLRPWLSRHGSAFNRVCAGLFASLGVSLPLSQ